jgi:hypothetical protein
MNARGAPRLDQIFLTATNHHQAEAHDCQRLVTQNAAGVRSLGPLVGIFPDSGAMTRPSSGQVVAEIYNFDGGNYPALGLEDGLNCLWMGQSGGSWESVIFQPTATAGQADCLGAQPPTTGGVALTTSARVWGNPNAGADDYPPTARWMWRDGGTSQFIGIRCGAAWCEISPSSVPVVTDDFRRRDSIPGYFDRQYLSYDRNGQLALSRLMGTIHPGPAAAAPKDDLAQAAQVAAVIRLLGQETGVRAVYRNKLQIATQITGNGLSQDRIMMQVGKLDTPGTPSDEWWGWSQALGKGQGMQFQRGVNVMHSSHGTVRWRWFEDDEGGWIPCFDGCCTWRR